MEKRGRKPEGKYSRWSPLSLSSMMMSGPLLFTHTHCPTLMPRSSVCELARSLSPPQTDSLLPSHSLALSPFSLWMMSLALPCPAALTLH